MVAKSLGAEDTFLGLTDDVPRFHVVQELEKRVKRAREYIKDEESKTDSYFDYVWSGKVDSYEEVEKKDMLMIQRFL